VRETELGENERSSSTGVVSPPIAKTSAGTIRPHFTIEGLRWRCALKHRNSRRETAGWDRIDRQEVFVLCWKAGPNVGSAEARAGSMNVPGPFNFAAEGAAAFVSPNFESYRGTQVQGVWVPHSP
jgi:hypothetical protein